jgi:hypothetical protein
MMQTALLQMAHPEFVVATLPGSELAICSARRLYISAQACSGVS